MILPFPSSAIETNDGHFLKMHSFQMGFGKADAHLQKMKERFSTFNFFGVKQTHSDTVIVHSPHDTSDAFTGDALITRQANTAIYIKTADCTPILCFDSATGGLAAIHAGWRGVANQITKKTLLKMINEFDSQPENLHVFIGPHIQFASFEVEEDVMLKLIASVRGPTSSFVKAKDKKFLVDLQGLVGQQLHELGIEKIWSLNKDTLTDLNYHSYRRDKTSGRLISFIAKTER